jgi:SIR2-like domain
MEIPAYLETMIREGKAVLFLGAGASLDATNVKGEHPPTTRLLTELLADRFLGGKYRDWPLNQVGELAISESDLTTVQEYIRELLEDFRPTAAHALMTSFRWDCLATTNYDLLVEKAYAAEGKKAAQMPIPFIENGDRVEDRLRDSRGVMYLKLHGCITRTTNESCPLILTTDQYIESMKGRSRIFEHLRTKAFEHVVVFVGYGLQDTNMRMILLDLAKLGDKRPRYFLVGPHFDDVQRRFWETKRITPIEGTFDSFMKALDAKIVSPFRGLAVTPSAALPIAERFVKHDVTLTQNCLQFLETHAEYVKGVTATEKVNPADFYKGENPGWSAVEQGLDCRRQLSDVILSEHFIDKASADEMEVILVKAYAGAGKTVLLRRIAWDASRDYNMLCLYMQPSGVINTAAIQELISACDERMFLFVDNPLDRIRELQALMAEMGPQGKKLTVVMAARLNEWNVHGSGLSRFVSTEYELLYLTPKETDSLIGLLEKHHSLGTLEKASPEERRAAFGERAGRQLLVALHEATLGPPFEDIVENEYRNIIPHEAQKLYLSICVLNRLDVRVRAGLISRTHNIPFEEFRERLFKPLEHVVKTEMDRNIRDHVYHARHPHIAEIVFERILKTQEQRYEEYIRCINGMNIDYSTDRKAFNAMTRGRAVIEMFPNHELARLMYQAAQEIAGDDAHLFHQMGIYEMIRPNGNLALAQKHLLKAQELFPKSTYIN